MLLFIWHLYLTTTTLIWASESSGLNYCNSPFTHISCLYCSPFSTRRSFIGNISQRLTFLWFTLVDPISVRVKAKVLTFSYPTEIISDSCLPAIPHSLHTNHACCFSNTHLPQGLCTCSFFHLKHSSFRSPLAHNLIHLGLIQISLISKAFSDHPLNISIPSFPIILYLHVSALFFIWHFLSLNT